MIDNFIIPTIFIFSVVDPRARLDDVEKDKQSRQTVCEMKHKTTLDKDEVVIISCMEKLK